jgi:hypothetical protein
MSQAAEMTVFVQLSLLPVLVHRAQVQAVTQKATMNDVSIASSGINSKESKVLLEKRLKEALNEKEATEVSTFVVCTRKLHPQQHFNTTWRQKCSCFVVRYIHR